MTFNELQRTWQKNENIAKLTIDSDLLIQEVKRNKKSFESHIFWRDFREVAIAIIMVGVFLYVAFESEANIWITGSFVIMAAISLYVAVFFLVDRHLQRKRQPRHTDSLLTCIESSLAQVNHQIWLLKNVFWWYLLPPGVGIAMFFIVVNLHLFQVLPATRVLPRCLVSVLIVTLVFWGVYWLNQYAVRKGLIPRKRELESLLNSLVNGSKTM